MDVLEKKITMGKRTYYHIKKTKLVHTGVSIIGQYVKRKIIFYCLYF